MRDAPVRRLPVVSGMGGDLVGAISTDDLVPTAKRPPSDTSRSQQRCAGPREGIGRTEKGRRSTSYSRFPRSGNGALRVREACTAGAAPPHARGYTTATNRTVPDERVPPARAGIDTDHGRELSVNSRHTWAPLDIEASARLNSEFGRLDRLQLSVLGDVVATETADGDRRGSAVLRDDGGRQYGDRCSRFGGAGREFRDMKAAHRASILRGGGRRRTDLEAGGGWPLTARSLQALLSATNRSTAVRLPRLC